MRLYKHRWGELVYRDRFRADSLPESRESMYHELKTRLQKGSISTGIIGLGYVGLPLAVEMAQAGHRVIGIDLSNEKISMLRRGESYILDVSNQELDATIRSGRFQPTTDYSMVSKMNTISICVPTPLRKTKDPDTSYITAVVSELKRYLKKGTLIVLESTTYPGTTDELIGRELEDAGFAIGEDVFLCFSPERVDPGNKHYNTKNTPKVIGGVTPECTELGVALYSSVLDNVVPVSSTRVAETVKLLENTFRAVNIALVNEMALMCDRMGIDIWEVIDAAATKPFGFMKFTPGPGIGGHCIPLDPMYLSWKAKTYDFYNKFIELASDINGNMPRYVVTKASDVLNLYRKCLNGSRILLLGMAYKKDIDDVRESPGLELYKLLEETGAIVDFYDPHVPQFIDEHTGSVVHRIDLDEKKLGEYDLAILITDHSAFDYGWIAEHAQLILDTRNALNGVEGNNIVRIGSPIPEALKQRLTPAAVTKS